MSNLKNIDSRITSIRKRSGSLRTSIAECAVLIVEHAKEHGDCSRALKLCEAVPMASERVKLVQWFGLYSPINVTWAKDADKRRVGMRKMDAKGYNPFNLDGARVNPYYELTNDDDDTVKLLGSGDLNDLVLKLVKKFTGKLEKGEVVANDRENIEAKLAVLRTAATAVAAAA